MTPNPSNVDDAKFQVGDTVSVRFHPSFVGDVIATRQSEHTGLWMHKLAGCRADFFFEDELDLIETTS